MSIIAAYAGHLYPWKGVDVFVRALALAPHVRGLIVGGHPGEADRARVESLARELGLGGRLTITGLVPPHEVRQRLAVADVLVLPNTLSAISERYTSPLKLFEYLTLGRPIVASDLPALREILTDGVTALLSPPGDARRAGGGARASRRRPRARTRDRRGRRGAGRRVHMGAARGASRTRARCRGASLALVASMRRLSDTQRG